MTTANTQTRGKKPTTGTRTRGKKPILTPKIQKTIIDAILGGNYMETAAEYAGIHKSTLFDWLAKGRDAQDGHNIPNGPLYADFADAITRARAQVEVRMVGLVQKAAIDNWQAATWYLERTRPRTYGRLDRQEITGAEGQPLAVSVADQRAAAEAVLNEIASRGTEPA